MFDWLIHSGVRIKMLKMFFKNEGRPLYGLELAKTLHTSPGTIHRELNALIKQGIIKKKREGALVMHRLNTLHPYFVELKAAIFPQKKKRRALFISDLRLSLLTSAEILSDFSLFLDYAEENASEIIFLGNTIEMLENDVFSTYIFHKPLFDRLTELSHHLYITMLAGDRDCFLKIFCQDDTSGKFFDSRIVFAEEYQNPFWNIFARSGHFIDDDLRELMKFGKSRIKESDIKLMLHALNQEGFSLYQGKLLSLVEYAEKALWYAEQSKNHDSSTKLRTEAKDLMKHKRYNYVVFGNVNKPEVQQYNEGIYFNTGSFAFGKRSFVEIDNDGGAVVAIDELK